MKIDITGLDLAAVIAALHNVAKPRGMGHLQALGRPLTRDEAQQLLDRRVVPPGQTRPKDLYFDYVHGRPLKVDLSHDVFDPYLFDHNNGEGVAERAIEALRTVGHTDYSVGNDDPIDGSHT